MVSEKRMLKVLEKGDIEAIHGATLDVLSKTGVFVDSPPVLNLLEKNGHIVDSKTRTVKMSESSVMDAVRSCVSSFRWHARNDRNTIEVVDGRTKFGPGSQCLYYIDPETDEFRQATLPDGIVSTVLLDAIDTCSISFMPTHPSDVPPDMVSPVTWATTMLNTSKPGYGSYGEKSELEMTLKIAELVLGNRDDLRKKPVFPGYICPISPLGHDKGMLETLIRCSELEIPVFVMVMALAGGTAPASLAGLLVQQNAEILSSIVIAKCVTKTPKVVYGSVSCPLDMRSGIATTGSPEFSLIGVGSVQLAKHYNLPSDMGVQSDSKAIDAQTSYEKMQSAVMATLAGADLAELFMGSTEAYNAFSPIQLMIDDEIASDVLRIAQGIEVNESTLSVDVIAKIGPQGNFLRHKDTLQQYKRQHHMARLSDRATRRQWVSAGGKKTDQRAKEKVSELIRTHSPEPLEPELRKGLEEILRARAKGFDLRQLELA